MITEVPVEQLRELYTTATRFRMLAPWKWMEDEEVFGIVHPVTGEKIYLTIMGNLGEYFALGVYPGVEGLRSLNRLFDEENGDDSEEAIYHQHCLICSFEDHDELEPDDHALIKHVGIKFQGENAYPNFRSYRPGYMPWVLGVDEVALMQVALEQAIWVGEQVKADPGLLGPKGLQDKLYFRIPTQNGVRAWKSEVLPADNKIDLSPPQLSIPLGEIASLKQLKRSDAIWLFEQLYLGMPSMDPGEERPFFPKALVMLDIEDQTMAGVEVVKPSEAEDSIAGMMVSAFRDNGSLPGQIVVATREHYILLKSFCKALNIDLYLDPEMQVIPELREAIMEMMEGQQDQED
jgi:hypothetical protein